MVSRLRRPVECVVLAGGQPRQRDLLNLPIRALRQTAYLASSVVGTMLAIHAGKKVRQRRRSRVGRFIVSSCHSCLTSILRRPLSATVEV
jgi:hypothetical protein